VAVGGNDHFHEPIKKAALSSLKNCNLYWAGLVHWGGVHVARCRGLEHVHLGDRAVSVTILSNSLLP
jgi:hypothetical protein